MKRITMAVLLGLCGPACGTGSSSKALEQDTGEPVPGSGDSGDSGDPGDSGDSGDSGDPGDPEEVEAVLGASCPAHRRLGVVELIPNVDGVYVSASALDRLDLRLEEPVEINETCAFHKHERNDCTTCPEGEVCTSTGCQPRAVRRDDIELVVNVDGSPQTFLPISQGVAYGYLDGEADTYDISFSIGHDTVSITGLPHPAAMPEVTVTISSDELAPGPLEATWTPSDSTDRVHTRIPMNHHVIEETFTECSAPASSGQFYATAAMIDPLSVVTGLEFQEVAAGQVAAAEFSDGSCVELRAERRARPDFERRPD